MFTELSMNEQMEIDGGIGIGAVVGLIICGIFILGMCRGCTQEAASNE